jgi:hypothetical protein
MIVCKEKTIDYQWFICFFFAIFFAGISTLKSVCKGNCLQACLQVQEVYLWFSKKKGCVINQYDKIPFAIRFAKN